MENSILKKEDIYVKEGYKQIYPNDKDIKITLLTFVNDWNWICDSFQTRRLTLGESIKNMGAKFFVAEKATRDSSTINLRLKKESQSQEYRVEKIYLSNNKDGLIQYTDKLIKDYSSIAKKIDKIYFDMARKFLLISFDEHFISKQEQKYLSKKTKSIEAKKSISELFE